MTQPRTWKRYTPDEGRPGDTRALGRRGAALRNGDSRANRALRPAGSRRGACRVGEGRGGRLGHRRLRRARCLRGGSGHPRRRPAEAARVRHRRRGGVRGRPPVRRHRPHLRRHARPGARGADRRGHPGRATGGPHGQRRRRVDRGKAPRVRRRRRERRGGREGPRAARARADRVRHGGRGGGVRLVVRATPEDVRVRRHRLRLDARLDRPLHGLPRDRLRRACEVRDARALPGRRRARRRLAGPLPRVGSGRRANRDLRAHPRREVRRPHPEARALDECRLHRRHGLPANHRATLRAAARGRRDGRGSRARARAYRPPDRLAQPGGGRHRDRGRDHLGVQREDAARLASKAATT